MSTEAEDEFERLRTQITSGEQPDVRQLGLFGGLALYLASHRDEALYALVAERWAELGLREEERGGIYAMILGYLGSPPYWANVASAIGATRRSELHELMLQLIAAQCTNPGPERLKKIHQTMLQILELLQEEGGTP